MTYSACIVCGWCAGSNATGALSCQFCGAPLDVRNATGDSGWTKAPLIPDMTSIPFDNSICQVEGSYVPVAEIKLAAGDALYFAHHVLLWKDPGVTLTARRMPDQWAQSFAGMPIYMLEAEGPGHIAFSRDQPGKLLALPLQVGQEVHVREHIFLAASRQIAYDWFNPHIWYSTKDGRDQRFNWPVGQFMDSFRAERAPGLLLLCGAGDIFARRLAPDETILVKPTGLLFKDTTVRMSLHIEQPEGGKPTLGWRGQRHVWLQLQGPGRVAIQSAFKHMDDNGKPVVRSSPATRREW